MKEDEFNHRLRELIDIASGTKTKKRNKAISKTTTNKTNMSDARVANSLQELRICIKYLLLEVEATRRERDKFKNMLDDQVPPLPD